MPGPVYDASIIHDPPQGLYLSHHQWINYQAVEKPFSHPWKSGPEKVSNNERTRHRMFKKVVQRGRSEGRGEAYSLRYVEPLREARTKLAAFFNILLGVDEGFGGRLSMAFDPNPSLLNSEATFCKELDGLGVDSMLLGQYPSRERFRGVTFQYGDHGLNDDRPLIHAFRHKVDRTTGNFHPPFQGFFLNLQPRKGREK